MSTGEPQQELAGPEVIGQIVRYYADQELTKPLSFAGGSMVLYWGEVRAGTSNPLIFFIQNINPHKIQLKPHVPTDPDVKIVRYPSELEPNAVGPIEIDFQCPINRTTPPSSLFGFDFLIVKYV